MVDSTPRPARDSDFGVLRNGRLQAHAPREDTSCTGTFGADRVARSPSGNNPPGMRGSCFGVTTWLESAWGNDPKIGARLTMAH